MYYNKYKILFEDNNKDNNIGEDINGSANNNQDSPSNKNSIGVASRKQYVKEIYNVVNSIRYILYEQLKIVKKLGESNIIGEISKQGFDFKKAYLEVFNNIKKCISDVWDVRFNQNNMFIRGWDKAVKSYYNLRYMNNQELKNQKIEERDLAFLTKHIENLKEAHGSLYASIGKLKEIKNRLTSISQKNHNNDFKIIILNTMKVINTLTDLHNKIKRLDLAKIKINEE